MDTELTERVESEVSDQLADIGFVARSSNRLRILEELDSGDKKTADLRETLDIPRTTLRRNLVELVEKNWIAEDPTCNEYSINQAGRIVLESFTRTIERIDQAGRLAAFYNHMPDSMDIETDNLQNCSVTCTTDAHPHKPMMTQISIIQQASDVQAVFPVLSPHFLERIADVDTSFDQLLLVSERSHVERVRTNLSPNVRRLLDQSGHRFCATDNVPAFGLCLADDVRNIATYTPNMRIHTVLEASTGSTVAEWIDETFESTTGSITEVSV